jgi:hypothetical protein
MAMTILCMSRMQQFCTFCRLLLLVYKNKESATEANPITTIDKETMDSVQFLDF